MRSPSLRGTPAQVYGREIPVRAFSWGEAIQEEFSPRSSSVFDCLGLRAGAYAGWSDGMIGARRYKTISGKKERFILASMGAAGPLTAVLEEAEGHDQHVSCDGSSI